MKTITINDIRSAREKYRAEHDMRQVRIPEYVTVDYTPLEKLPDISLKFIVGGGWSLTFDYLIIGGPDNGKRVCLTPWRSEDAFVGMGEKYNGTMEEFERELGYTSRPAIHSCITLHVSTIMFIRGLLHGQREHLMAEQIDSMYKRLDEQRVA